MEIGVKEKMQFRDPKCETSLFHGKHVIRSLVTGTFLTIAAIGAQAETVSSLADVRVFGELCDASGCSTPLFDDGSVLTETSGDLNVALAYSSGATSAGTVSASADANLTAGTLKISSEALGIAPSAYAFAVTVGRLADTITVTNSDGSTYAGGGISTLSIAIDGQISGESDLFLALRVYQDGALSTDPTNGFAFDFQKLIASDQANYLSTDTLPTMLSVNFNTPDSPFVVYISAFSSFQFRQDSTGSLFALTDLGHTLTASLVTPEGTTYSSVGGFPGPGVYNVPEPGTLALVLGCLGLWRLRWRQCDCRHFSVS